VKLLGFGLVLDSELMVVRCAVSGLLVDDGVCVLLLGRQWDGVLGFVSYFVCWIYDGYS